MSFAELLEELHKLSPEELAQIQDAIEQLHQTSQIEETPEMLAAIDEGIRSLREEPTITLEELRKEMHTWNTDSK